MWTHTHRHTQSGGDWYFTVAHCIKPYLQANSYNHYTCGGGETTLGSMGQERVIQNNKM